MRKLGRALACQWLLSGSLPVLRVSLQEERHAKEFLEKFSDKDWGLCDALSFAVISNRSVGAAFSFDRHLLQFGRCRIPGAH
ncbi:MAG TPA: hypothetical protein VFG91_01355 [Woeseiaceae bacterium]|nr:hypothetical protein [Woeseiaceae bacterium]